MLIADILHSCSNERVAEAAVASIGGEFADQVRALARRDGLAVGAFVGKLVSRFALDAHERDWRLVVVAIGSDELPVLAGLRAVLEAMIRTQPAAVAEPGKTKARGGLTATPKMEIEIAGA